MILLSGSLVLPFASTLHIFHSPVLGNLLLLLLLLFILTEIELSFGGSNPYTSRDKTIGINIHKGNNAKNRVHTIQNTVNTSKHITKTPTYYTTHTYTHPHITKPTHTHTRTLHKPPTNTHLYTTKQVNTTTVQVKTTTVQDIPK